MAIYAKIINKGECYSTTQLTVNGVPANKWEWAKYNFYPQNGMVGELLTVNGKNVLKILEGVYVPMTKAGFIEISYKEYEAEKINNVCSGMDERQKKINTQLDALIDQLKRFGL